MILWVFFKCGIGLFMISIVLWFWYKNNFQMSKWFWRTSAYHQYIQLEMTIFMHTFLYFIHFADQISTRIYCSPAYFVLIFWNQAGMAVRRAARREAHHLSSGTSVWTDKHFKRSEGPWLRQAFWRTTKYPAALLWLRINIPIF